MFGQEKSHQREGRPGIARSTRTLCCLLDLGGCGTRTMRPRAPTCSNSPRRLPRGQSSCSARHRGPNCARRQFSYGAIRPAHCALMHHQLCRRASCRNPSNHRTITTRPSDQDWREWCGVVWAQKQRITIARAMLQIPAARSTIPTQKGSEKVSVQKIR